MNSSYRFVGWVAFVFGGLGGAYNQFVAWRAIAITLGESNVVAILTGVSAGLGWLFVTLALLLAYFKLGAIATEAETIRFHIPNKLPDERMIKMGERLRVEPTGVRVLKPTTGTGPLIGLRQGDLITHVNGVALAYMPTPKAQAVAVEKSGVALMRVARRGEIVDVKVGE